MSQEELFRVPKARPPSIRARILEHFESGQRLTGEAVALLVDKPLSTVRPELSKLRAAGNLAPCGVTKHREIVWIRAELFPTRKPHQTDAFQGDETT